MYETERQTLQRCCDMFRDKGWREPEAKLQIEDDGNWLIISAKHPISDDWSDRYSRYHSGDTLQECFDNFFERFKDVITEDQAKDDILRKKLAELIDLGDKHSFDALIMQTLRDEMKKLSENILEDKS